MLFVEGGLHNPTGDGITPEYPKKYDKNDANAEISSLKLAIPPKLNQSKRKVR